MSRKNRDKRENRKKTNEEDSSDDELKPEEKMALQLIMLNTYLQNELANVSEEHRVINELDDDNPVAASFKDKTTGKKVLITSDKLIAIHKIKKRYGLV